MSVMRTALTRDEFANALGMKSNELFVRKMFKIVDKNMDGRISFQVKTDIPFWCISSVMNFLHIIMKCLF